MAEFEYTARDMSGERISGTMDANSERDVISALTAKSLFPIEVIQAAGTKQIKLNFGRVSPAKVAVFYAQLASLMKNGVPLLRSLNILREQSSNETLKNALTDVVTHVEDGETLSESFGRHPRVFNEMAVNMSRAGAEGGFLEDALERVALFTEQQSELKSRTVGALIYPLVLSAIGTIVVAILIIFFVPQFESLFGQLRAKGELPWATEFLLGFSKSLQSYGLLIAGFFGVVITVLYFQLKTDRGRDILDAIKIKVPMFGPIFLNLAVARFCRVLGTLLKNGVPILKGLEISADAAGNRVLTRAIEDASENITSGEALSAPLSASGHFPRNVTEMISVAEESNTLDDVLVNVADGLEKTTIRRLDIMVKMIEPLLLLVMAAVVLVVVVALLIPVIKMGTAFE